MSGANVTPAPTDVKQQKTPVPWPRWISRRDLVGIVRGLLWLYRLDEDKSEFVPEEIERRLEAHSTSRGHGRS